MKKLLIPGVLLTVFLASCGGGGTSTPAASNVDPSGKWVATETVNGEQRAWDMDFRSFSGSWSASTGRNLSNGAVESLEIKGTHTLSTSYPLNSSITVLQMGNTACKIDGIAYSLKSIVTGQFVSANLYKGTEDHFICDNGGFVYAATGTFAMTKN